MISFISIEKTMQCQLCTRETVFFSEELSPVTKISKEYGTCLDNQYHRLDVIKRQWRHLLCDGLVLVRDQVRVVLLSYQLWMRAHNMFN